MCGLQVKLCDAASGGFTHTLVGHREGVWAACWSPTSEWHLITGGCDGQVLSTARGATHGITCAAEASDRAAGAVLGHTAERVLALLRST